MLNPPIATLFKDNGRVPCERDAAGVGRQADGRRWIGSRSVDAALAEHADARRWTVVVLAERRALRSLRHAALEHPGAFAEGLAAREGNALAVSEAAAHKAGAAAHHPTALAGIAKVAAHPVHAAVGTLGAALAAPAVTATVPLAQTLAGEGTGAHRSALAGAEAAAALRAGPAAPSMQALLSPGAVAANADTDPLAALAPAFRSGVLPGGLDALAARRLRAAELELEHLLPGLLTWAVGAALGRGLRESRAGDEDREGQSEERGTGTGHRWLLGGGPAAAVR